MESENVQVFFCEVCDVKLIIPIEPGIDVFSVILIIEDAHRELSPTCQNPVEKLKII